jgi:hypothetical protein
LLNITLSCTGEKLRSIFKTVTFFERAHLLFQKACEQMNPVEGADNSDVGVESPQDEFVGTGGEILAGDAQDNAADMVSRSPAATISAFEARSSPALPPGLKHVVVLARRCVAPCGVSVVGLPR